MAKGSNSQSKGRGFYNRTPDDEKKHKDAGRLGGLQRAKNMKARREQTNG